MKLIEAFDFCKKSTIKAGEGLEDGLYQFFTSSDTKKLFLNTYTYDCEAVILGTGGMPSCNYCCGKFATSTDTFVLKAKSDILPRFLYWFLRYDDFMILAKGFHGAGLKHISKEYIANIDLPNLSTTEQEYIIKIFDLCDSMSQSLHTKILFYDELVKSRFIELFGEPLTLLESGKTISLEKVFSEITVGFVGEAASSYVKVGIPYLRTQNVRKGYIDFSGLIYVSEEFHGANRKSQIKPGDIVVSRVGVNRGMAAVIPQTLEEANIANCLIIKKEKTVNSEYLAYYLNMSYGLSPKFGASVGSAQGVINTAILKKWEVFLPPYSQQEQFAAFVEQTDKSKLAATETLKYLEELKASLMNKYFG